jgi:hypothetical protein
VYSGDVRKGRRLPGTELTVNSYQFSVREAHCPETVNRKP